MPDFSNRLGLDSFDVPPVKPASADWPETLLDTPPLDWGDRFDKNMIKLEKSGKAGLALSYVLCAPVVVYNVVHESVANVVMAFKVLPGCGKWYSLHRYEWGMGYKSWWMYCDRCGKAVHDD